MTNFSKIKNVIKRKVNESRVRNTVSSILDDALPNILAELDVRKTHGDKRIENPATGNAIKLRTALKAKKGSAVYAKGKAMYNAFKDKPANESVKGKLERLKELLDTNVNERAYASTDGKPTFDYDPGEDKLTEAEDYKYKKYVAKAFKDILGAQFDFRHAMGVKQLTNKDMKLKKKADAIYKAIIDLQKDMKSKGLTEVQAMNMDTVPYNTIMKMKPGSTIKMKDGKIRTKDKFGNWRADTDPNDIIANRDVIKHMKGMKGFNIGNGRVRIEGKLTEAFKKGDKVKYLGHPATITNVKDYNGKTYYSVSYNKGSGKTKASSILSTDGTITEAKKIKPHGLGYRMNVRRAKADFKKGENIAAVSKQGLGSFKIEDQNDFNKYHPLQWDFAYIVKESKLTEAKIKKGDVIKMQDGEIGVVNKVKGRVAYIKLPSSPGSFHPIEADRTTYKGKHKGKDLYSETKGAPKGHYFTASGNVVKGRLSKAAKSKGARLSDPKDKQRSKVPTATQRNESAKDKFGAPPMNKWWTGSKESLMSAIYHAQRQLPPSNKAAYEKNWKNIVKQLQKKFPAPTDIYRKRLTEDYSQRARNFRVILRQRLDAMKSGQKISYGKNLSWVKDGKNFKTSKGRTVPAEDIVQDLKHAVKPDILRHRGARGADMVNAYLKFEGKARRKN